MVISTGIWPHQESPVTFHRVTAGHYKTVEADPRPTATARALVFHVVQTGEVWVTTVQGASLDVHGQARTDTPIVPLPNKPTLTAAREQIAAYLGGL